MEFKSAIFFLRKSNCQTNKVHAVCTILLVTGLLTSFNHEMYHFISGKILVSVLIIAQRAHSARHVECSPTLDPSYFKHADASARTVTSP